MQLNSIKQLAMRDLKIKSNTFYYYWHKHQKYNLTLKDLFNYYD